MSAAACGSIFFLTLCTGHAALTCQARARRREAHLTVAIGDFEMAARDAENSLQATVQRVLAAHASHALPIQQLHASSMPTNLPDAERLQRQRIAIAGIIKRFGLAGNTVIEFGAGDGALSRTLWSTGAALSFVLVDKSKKRMEHAPTPDGFDPAQLCVDVDVLDPATLRTAVDGCRDGTALTRDCVLLSNHLCGAALDSSIRCALSAWQSETQPGDSSDALAGVVAVTCCHHACAFGSFLGREYLAEAGLSAADFEAICRWSRLAPRRERPASSRPRVVEMAQQLGCTPDEAAELGMRCRHLMDSCRARYLAAHGFDVSLVHHVGVELTGDNVMILCTRKHEPQIS